MAVKVMNLFDAYAQSALPDNGGYIVSTFFDPTSSYVRYEVVAYNGVRNIELSAEGLTFRADGNKVYILCEPASYIEKQTEPCNRDAKHRVPHRYKELETITAKNQTKVMVSKEPQLSYSSFTVLKPSGSDLAMLFYNLPDVLATIEQFFVMTLNKEASIPQADAKKAALLVMQAVKQFTIFG